MYISKLVVKNYKLLKDVNLDLNEGSIYSLAKMILEKAQYLKCYQS